MIGRVHGRRTFDELQRVGRRTRAGALGVLYHRADADLPCVAFAISRRVGGAVLRNRARRQLRAVFAELARDEPSLVPAGHYLVSVRTVGWTHTQARTWLRQALNNLDP